mgnify:CR=1 FL=1
MDKANEKLIADRKQYKGKVPSSYPKTEDLANYKEKDSYPIHDSNKPGIVDLDIHSKSEQYIVSGGRDS